MPPGDAVELGKKAARFQSFAKHVSDDGRKLVQGAAFKDRTFEQRLKALEKREADVISQQGLLGSAEKALEKRTQEAVDDHALAIANLEKVRKELLGTDEALAAVYTEIKKSGRAAIAADVKAGVAVGLAQDKIEWQLERTQEQRALNKKEREISLRLDQSEAKIMKGVEKKILDDKFEMGRHCGIIEGCDIDAKVQYNHGYHFGTQSCTPKAMKQ